METKVIKLSKGMVLYVLFCTGIAILVREFIDLPPLIGNWELKAKSILQFQLSDNYYPPGAAIALIPFLWAGPDFWAAIFFYYAMSSGVYYKLCELVPSKKLRVFALLALPGNSYLTWLCLTSADQVIELLMLLLFGLNAMKHRFALTLFSGTFLCLTRPAYWIVFILVMYLLGKDLSRKSSKFRNNLLKSSGLFILFSVLIVNRLVFGSPNLSTSSSDTIFFSHQKFHYLTLPKFDMDVFLKNGKSTDPFMVVMDDERLNFVGDLKTRAALLSIIDNPQRFVFAQMQKVDSYFFSIQKVPNLPGEYELSSDEKSIVIGDERLHWSLALGHFSYFLYRGIWLLLFFVTVVWLSMLIISRTRLKPSEKYLLLPYLIGVIPCLLFYVETRFKICSELIAIPLLFTATQTFGNLIQKKSLHKQLMENRE